MTTRTKRLIGGGVHTVGMRTTVSLPDELFHAAERLARQSRQTRSQLYAHALAEYVAHHAEEAVTAAMNRVVDQLQDGAGVDPAFSGAAGRTLVRSEW